MTGNETVNILLVDDQPAKLLSYEVILAELGENLIKAVSAREAFATLLKHDIAVVLVDVCMPELDGYELAAMIRDHPRFAATAIIFVSAVALTDFDRLRGYECGAVDYIPVPVVPDLLRAKVRVFADLFRKTRELETLNRELERRVAERTEALARANAELELRVEERTREREAALAQVHEMQKLESLGQLTGGLAHDFNNLLMGIQTNLELLRKRLPDDPAAADLLDGALQNTTRGATLTRRLLAFARRQELKPEAVDVPRLVAGMLDMLRRSLGPTIEIDTDFESGLAPVRADPNQLELALLNLCLNARDAMEGGGSLTVTARRTVGAEGPGGVMAGEYVCIGVTDTGTGMDGVTLKRAAEPFFTTKEVGKGTGLGLPMVYGLAAQSGGAMQISSRPGVGTTVEVRLPVATEIVRPPALPPVAPAPPPCRILVVDDDAIILAGTAAMLEDLGHTVVEAASGLRALELLEADPAVDLVITDHAMPGMTGLELVGRIRVLRPELPVIIASGYADVQGNPDPRVRRIAKPYHEQDLARIIGTLLSDCGNPPRERMSGAGT